MSENINSINDDLAIYDNNSLTSFEGLDNLICINGNFWIGTNDFSGGGNPSLTYITGLENLNSISKTFWIRNNSSLISLAGLINLNYVGGSLGIDYNNTLISLVGLDNTDSDSINFLSIKYNNSLSDCDIQSVCSYLATTNGTIDIHNNAFGCNSQEEVEEACWTSVDEINPNNNLAISPNPISSSSVIEYTLHQSSPVTLQILDIRGQVVISLIDELQQQGEKRITFNSTVLKPGVYFCVLKTNKAIQTTKLKD